MQDPQPPRGGFTSALKTGAGLGLGFGCLAPIIGCAVLFGIIGLGLVAGIGGCAAMFNSNAAPETITPIVAEPASSSPSPASPDLLRSVPATSPPQMPQRPKERATQPAREPKNPFAPNAEVNRILRTPAEPETQPQAKPAGDLPPPHQF